MADVPGSPPPAGGAAIGPGGVAPAQAAAPSAPATDQPPAWFTSFVEKQFAPMVAKTEEKFSLIGKDFGKLRSKFRDDEPAQPSAPGAASPEKPADFRREFLEAQRFGELSAKLPETARKALNERIANGMSFTQASEFAELIASSAPPAASAGATPPGIAASAAPITGAVQWTQQKLGQLASRDPAQYDRVCDELAAQGISLFSLPLS